MVFSNHTAPKVPLMIDERMMESLAKFISSGSLNAMSLTKIDIVNPTPARRLAPKISIHRSESGFLEKPK